MPARRKSHIPGGMVGDAADFYVSAITDRNNIELAQTKTSAYIDDWLLCFHAQQSIEKLMKAVTVHRGGLYHKQHTMHDVARDMEATGLKLPKRLQKVLTLTPCAVVLRYSVALPPGVRMPFRRKTFLKLVDDFFVWVGSVV